MYTTHTHTHTRAHTHASHASTRTHTQKPATRRKKLHSSRVALMSSVAPRQPSKQPGGQDARAPRRQRGPRPRQHRQHAGALPLRARARRTRPLVALAGNGAERGHDAAVALVPRLAGHRAVEKRHLRRPPGPGRACDAPRSGASGGRGLAALGACARAGGRASGRSTQLEMSGEMYRSKPSRPSLKRMTGSMVPCRCYGGERGRASAQGREQARQQGGAVSALQHATPAPHHPRAPRPPNHERHVAGLVAAREGLLAREDARDAADGAELPAVRRPTPRAPGEP